MRAIKHNENDEMFPVLSARTLPLIAHLGRAAETG